jgi:uncharacterized protein YdeI (YjbR/CyaY-like superfamily)
LAPVAARTVNKKRTGERVATAAQTQDLSTLSFATAKAFGTWLAKHHENSPGVWLKLEKKTSSTRSLSYAEAVEVALAWGWIDGQKRSYDQDAWLQRFCPRGARSIWSKINREKALLLIERGEMRPPGLAQVQAAQADGRWQRAYDSSRTATVPTDLAAALAGNARAQRFFRTLDARNRYAILHRLQTAKTEKTRADRLQKFITMLAQGEKIHG